MEILVRNVCRILSQPILRQNLVKALCPTLSAAFHTSPNLSQGYIKGPKKFEKYNKIIYPPQELEEEPRKAFVCHIKKNIKYSPKKMWYVASFVRGMTVDEAVKQLTFVPKKGAIAVKEAILEAQEIAVKDHNVEYKTNLWIAESFTMKGTYFKGVRRHARMRVGRIQYKHCHYFLRLEEGTPPEHYYLPYPKTPQQQLEEWVKKMRKRKIVNSL